MKHCQPCNLDFPIGYRFCGSCGGTLADSITCFACGELVDSKWNFCTGCGKTVRDEPTGSKSVRRTASASALEPPTLAADTSAREWYAAPELFDDISETTATGMRVDERPTSFPPAAQIQGAPLAHGRNNSGSRNSRDIPTLTMLSAYGQSAPVEEPATPTRYPVVFGLVLIASITLLGSGAWYVWSRTSASSLNLETLPGPNHQAAENQFASAAAGETPAERAITNDADEEWKRLRERRAAARSSESGHLISSLHEAEEKYPADYRFPYERAKLSIKGVVSHHDAFSALSSAAEKAIDNGKAREMLDNLLADKDGDFWKPSHGHREWPALEEALRNKDKTRLRALHR